MGRDIGGTCDVCGRSFTQRMGRPRKRCDDRCSRVAETLTPLKELIADRPGALLWLLESLVDVEIPRDQLSESDFRRVRSAAFTLASTGRRLAPGSSRRYPKRKDKAPRPDPT